MVLDQQKFDILLDSKKLAYSAVASKTFFDNNSNAVPCGMSEKAAMLYHILNSGVSYKEEEFTEEDRNEVKAFALCLETQMKMVLDGTLKPVDIELDQIVELVSITKLEIEACCVSKEEIIKMMEEVK